METNKTRQTRAKRRERAFCGGKGTQGGKNSCAIMISWIKSTLRASTIVGERKLPQERDNNGIAIGKC